MKIIDVGHKFSKSYIVVFGLAFVVLMGIVDYLTGIEVSFSIFYLIPIALVSWFSGRKTGIIFSILCAFLWFMVENIGGYPYSNPFIIYWNTAVRGGGFLTIALLVAQLKYFFEIERRRSEESLRESEERYRNLVEQANDGIAIVQDTEIKYVNPSLVEIAGYTIEEVIGTPFADYVHPDDFYKVVDRYKRRIAGEDIEPIYELAIKRKDGSKAYVEVNAGIIMYQGKPAEFVIVRDLTNRKWAEEVIEESRKKYLELYEDAPVGYQEIDIEGIIVHVNQTEADMLGYTIDEMVGKSVFDFIDRDQQEIAKNRHKERIQKQLPPQNFERKYITKSGNEIYFSITDKPVFNEKGQVTGVRSTLQDITERKQMEEILKKTEEKFRTVIENVFKFVPESLVVFTDKLNLFRSNKAFEDLVRHYAVKLNYSEEELTDILIEKVKTKLITGDKSEIRIPKKYK